MVQQRALEDTNVVAVDVVEDIAKLDLVVALAETP
jgi:hypothetical protein